ncbi:putative Ubiquitin-like domain, BAG domain, Ubiquitin-like domain superfamily [Dioscorea sansibarensis]
MPRVPDKIPIWTRVEISLTQTKSNMHTHAHINHHQSRPFFVWVLSFSVVLVADSGEKRRDPNPLTTTMSGGGGGFRWEMRPGGMLVQMRSADPEAASSPHVRVRVTCGSSRYEFSVAPNATTFGDLKKFLATETGLQPAEQRLLYKGKERMNGEFLDACGVKDRSKLVLTEDPSSLERRYIAMRKNARIQSAHRAILCVSMELDMLADQVSAIEKSISSRNKMPEIQITTLIELLMRQAVKLDCITTEGDTSLQKNVQAKRVQNYVETLDVLKIRNSRLQHSVVTINWEIFN